MTYTCADLPFTTAYHHDLSDMISPGQPALVAGYTGGGKRKSKRLRSKRVKRSRKVKKSRKVKISRKRLRKVKRSNRRSRKIKRSRRTR